MFGAVILHWQMESDYMVWKIFGNTLFKGKSSKLQNIQHQNFIKDWEPSDKRQSIWHSSSNKTARPHLVFWCLFFLTQYIRNYSYSSVIFLWSPKSFIIVLTHPHLVVFTISYCHIFYNIFCTYFIRSIFHYYYLLIHSIFNEYMYQTINPLLNIFVLKSCY